MSKCPKAIIILTKDYDPAKIPWPDCIKHDCGCWSTQNAQCGLIHEI